MTAILKEERIGRQRLILGDCLQVMKELDAFDALVTDPPYGIGAGNSPNNWYRRREDNFRPNLVAKYYRSNLVAKNWDNETKNAEIDFARSICKYQIIFGGNYYDLPPTSCWLVWDKKTGNFSSADCELAWTNLSKAVRKIDCAWSGCMRVENNIPREHPTQKPIRLMKWCIGHLPPKTQSILDPFIGSGTTLVACESLGKNGVGIEVDREYFDVACRRVEEVSKQANLFSNPQDKSQNVVGALQSKLNL